MAFVSVTRGSQASLPCRAETYGGAEAGRVDDANVEACALQQHRHVGHDFVEVMARRVAIVAHLLLIPPEPHHPPDRRGHHKRGRLSAGQLAVMVPQTSGVCEPDTDLPGWSSPALRLAST
jgi:hypothetical protein